MGSFWFVIGWIKKGLKLGANSWVPCDMIQELFGLAFFFPTEADDLMGT